MERPPASPDDPLERPPAEADEEPRNGGQSGAETPLVLAAELLCPRCGTPYTETQEYCLGCGIRLATSRVAPPAAAGVGERLPWSIGEWARPVALAFLVAAVGAGAAIAISAWTDDEPATIATRTSGLAPTGGDTTVPTTTVPTTAPPTTRPGTTPRRPGRRPRRERPPAEQPLVSWPAGRTGYTIVLASIPTTRGRAGAESLARAAKRSGIRAVGVLESSEFSSLHPGYFVVFSGVYASGEQAADALSSVVASGYRHAYARRVVP